MNAIVDKVRSLWIPLKEMNLLLPNVAVAEVIGYQQPETLVDGPEWLMGSMVWRDYRIPVVSYEAYCGLPAPADADAARITVMNTTRGDTRLPFYALVTSGIPRLFLADEEGLGDALGSDEFASEHSVSAVRLGSEQAEIPDIDRLHRDVEAFWLTVEQ